MSIKIFSQEFPDLWFLKWVDQDSLEQISNVCRLNEIRLIASHNGVIPFLALSIIGSIGNFFAARKEDGKKRYLYSFTTGAGIGLSLYLAYSIFSLNKRISKLQLLQSFVSAIASSQNNN